MAGLLSALKIEVNKSPSNVQVETVNTSADKAKLIAAAALLIGGLVAFYVLETRDLWLRVLALLGLGALAVGVFFTTESGKALIAYGNDSVREVRKVVWPSRQESMQMTGYVFAFVVVMALFLWLTDKTLEWVFYDLILGWRS